MRLDYSSLENAVGQLEEALALYESEIVQSNPRLQKHLRAAAIQAFEFTYELSFKMIKRYLETAVANPATLGTMEFKSVIREAIRHGLVASELTDWIEYRANRGTTSHTYDEHKAQTVFRAIPTFLEESRHLVSEFHLRDSSDD